MLPYTLAWCTHTQRKRLALPQAEWVICSSRAESSPQAAFAYLPPPLSSSLSIGFPSSQVQDILANPMFTISARYLDGNVLLDKVRRL
jgi:hypothetical protein